MKRKKSSFRRKTNANCFIEPRKVLLTVKDVDNIWIEENLKNEVDQVCIC